MEVRIMEPVLPDTKPVSAAVPAVTDSADASVRGPLRQALCGTKESPAPFAMTIRHHIRRNAAQHLQLARTPAELTAAGAPEAICATFKSKTGPEWYLRVRDNLFRAKSKHMP
jgi:hypothetical protein